MGSERQCRAEVPLPGVWVEVFQRRVEVVVNLKVPFGDAKTPSSVGRPHPNEPSDWDITLREHELLSRAKPLQEFSNRSSLLHFDRMHVGTVAPRESRFEPRCARAAHSAAEFRPPLRATFDT